MFKWEEIKCPICQHEHSKTLGKRGGKSHRRQLGEECIIVQCTQCTHIYPNPMPIITDHNKAYENAHHYFENHPPEAKIRNAEKLINELGKPKNLLDIGSGRGEIVYAAKKLGCNAIGLEPSNDFRAYAKQHYKISLKNQLVDTYYPKKKFDCVTIAAVLEHVYDPKELVQHIYRLLKPGGTLWLDIPHEASLYNKFGNLYFKLSGKDWVTHISPTFIPFHVQGFTKKSIRYLLNNQGFEVISLKTYPLSVPLKPKTLKEKIEWIGAKAATSMERIFNLGSGMEIIAKK